MKKIITLALALVMVLSALASCAQNNNDDGKVTDSETTVSSDTTASDTTAADTTVEDTTAADTEAPAGDKAFEDVIQQMYDSIEGTEWPMFGNMEITTGEEGNIEYYIGTKNVDLVRGIANEPMIGSIAHSVVMIEVKDGSDVEAVKADIKENVNPRKWICVEVDPKDVRVESEGNVICLIMVNDYSEALANAFHDIMSK